MATSPRGRNEDQNRSQRIPLGTPRRKLSLTPKQEAEMKFRGVVPRWINDRGDRLNEAIKGGYTFERDPETAAAVGVGGGNDISAQPGLDTRISRVVGVDDAGKLIRAYLMSVSKEFFDEDQKVIQDQILDQEKGMMRGLDAKGKPVDGTYVPTTGDGPPKMEIEYKPPGR